MVQYAQTTSVSSEKSRAEIERILLRYGADGFMYGWEKNTATVMFKMNGRMIKFYLELPDKEQFKYTSIKRRVRGTPEQLKAWEQATRQIWRALALVIKAKLEAVESNITTFDEEFLAHILLPDGTTVGEVAVPRIRLAYETGEMPKLLPE